MSECLIVRGGNPLHGSTRVSGAKNSALKLMAAGLLTEETNRISNVPDIGDVRIMMEVLRHLGARVEYWTASWNWRAGTRHPPGALFAGPPDARFHHRAGAPAGPSRTGGSGHAGWV